MTQKPNIILFMVDQLTSFVLKSYGGTVCKTPNIDALAKRGTVFENAYCPYPLCAPSRFGMMSGRLPSRIGAYDNGAEFTASTPTFAHYLRANGYYTCISGKMHFVGPDQFHGFEERLTTEIYPADMSWTPEADFRDYNKDEERAYTFGVSTIDTVRDAGPVARSMQIDYDEDVIHHAVRELYTRARGTDDRPFMMTVSLTHPHDPYVITREYWDLYADEDIDAPQVPHTPVEERDAHSQSLYYHYGQDKCELSDKDYRNARRGYYGMISYIDDLFGRLMRALNDSGFSENTVVVFASDHGDMIGERGMWFKKTLFNPAIQVPLLIAHPDQDPAQGSRACVVARHLSDATGYRGYRGGRDKDPPGWPQPDAHPARRAVDRSGLCRAYRRRHVSPPCLRARRRQKAGDQPGLSDAAFRSGGGSVGTDQYRRSGRYGRSPAHATGRRNLAAGHSAKRRDHQPGRAQAH